MHIKGGIIDMNKFKRGKIKISFQLYENDFELISPMFTKFQVLHIEQEHWNWKDYIFTGVCDDFRELKEGEQIPFYDCIFTRQEDGSHTFKFVEL
jgi:hypothetical protein